MIKRVRKIIDRIDAKCLGTPVDFRVEYDNILGDHGRVFIQCTYHAPDRDTAVAQRWSGRKWYLSDYMTDDEIVKTAYLAFDICIKHEILEGFHVDGKPLFNPHVNFEQMLTISHMEVKRS